MHDMTIDCSRTRELLPWWLNETLEPAERQAVATHLAACDACRGELEETRQTLAAASLHLPIEVLLARAGGEELPAGIDAEVVEVHLASCEPCTEELEMLRQSREALDDEAKLEPEAESTVLPQPAVLPWRAAPARALASDGAAARAASRWRNLAAAAALVALLAGLAAVLSLRELARVRGGVGGRTPIAAQVAVVDLHPRDLVLRDEGVPVVRLPVSATPSTLILNTRLPASAAPFQLEVTSATGVTWVELDMLMPDVDGLISISLVTAELVPEELVPEELVPEELPGTASPIELRLTLTGAAGQVESYVLQLD